MSIPERFRQQRVVERAFPLKSVTVPSLTETGMPSTLHVFHRGFVIEPRFPLNYPYEPPLIYLRPAPRSRHYYVHAGEQEPRLCYLRPGEWSPRMELLVAICSAMRFINDYLAHRVD